MSEFIDSGQSATLRVSFFDELDAPAAPLSVSYTIVCRTTGTEIKPATVVTPAAVVDIVLTAADNTIVNNANRAERRRVIVTATDAVGALPEVFEYTLLNRN